MGIKLFTTQQRELAERNIALVYWFVYSQIENIKKIKYDEIEELISLLCLTLCNVAYNFKSKPNNTFATYAYKSFKHTVLDYFKEKEKEKNKNIITSTFKNLEILYEEEEKNINWEEIKNIFNKSKISDRNQKILVLYFYHKKSYREVGKMFNLTYEGVRKIIKKSLLKIKKNMNEKDYDF